MICIKCNINFEAEIKHGYTKQFCSRKCANSRLWNDSDKLKKSNSLKVSQKHLLASQLKQKRVQKICLVCESNFYTRPSNKKKLCSRNCFKQYCVIKRIGGYKEGSGRSKSGVYKNIFCASTYELVWVIFNIDNNLPFKRFEGYLQDENLTYYPDFIVGNNIIEIKGYHTPLVDKKIELAKNKGYTIQVLYKNDLQICFDWVKNNYKYTSLIDLYDKNRYKVYNCLLCSKEFSTYRKPKVIKTFCSKGCANKYNKNL